MTKIRAAVYLALLFPTAASVYACKSDRPSDTSSEGVGSETEGGAQVCTAGREGCPCSSEGATTGCGHVVIESGDYVTCSEGQATCKDGQWSACVGNTLVTKSLAQSTIGAGSVRVLSTTSACSNPCDPNTCTQTSQAAGDVDASGVATVDGSLTLSPSTIIVSDASGDGATCTGMQCQVSFSCPNGSPTTLTGVVYDPAGVNPLYNAYVYIPTDPTGTLPAFSTGATCDSCAGAGSLNAVSVGQTGTDGSFTLTNVPSTDLAPNKPIPLVIQMGKWRREVMLPSVPKCTTTTVAPSNSRLPRNKFDGFNGQADIPKMAIATGNVDPFECLLLKMGLDPAEFQLPAAGTRRVDYYMANGQDFYPSTSSFNMNGSSSSPFTTGTALAPAESNLVGSLSTLMGYDVIILPCEGFEDTAGNDKYADNVSAYANAGGRVFTTHYGYTWLATPTGSTALSINPATGKTNPFYGVATWALNAASYTSAGATIDTTLSTGAAFPKGVAFTQWMQNVGATTTAGSLTLQSPRRDMTSVKGSSTEWMKHNASPNETYHLTFNTPFVADAGVDAGADASAAAVCGRVVFSDYHVSTSDILSSTSCNTNADCGYGATCSAPVMGSCTAVSCVQNSDCTSGYTCVGGVAGTCKPQACSSALSCATAVCNSSGCGCTKNSQCSSGTCNKTTTLTCTSSSVACSSTSSCKSSEACQGAVTGTCQKTCASNTDCTAGELCNAGKCQGCYDGTYCPSGSCNGGVDSACTPTGNSFPDFPMGCAQGALTAQEDALEFMLFDLTACISSDSAPPPAPPQPVTVYNPVTFTEDFSSSCASGTHVVWRELDWKDTIPSTSSISFSAQTADPGDGGVTDFSKATVIPLATATTSTNLPNYDVALIDAAPTGAFNTASPAVVSKSSLRLTITMNPTTDKKSTPALLSWQVLADCAPSE